MTHRLVVGNTHKDPAALRQIITAGDYVMLNEAEGAVQAEIRKLAATGEWDAYQPTGPAALNPHVWRFTKIVVLSSTSRTIMQGGRLGLAGMRVARRDMRSAGRKPRGPSRAATATWVEECTVNSNGTIVRNPDAQGIYVDVHLIHQAFTRARWKKPLHYASVVSLTMFLRYLEKRHPGVPIILAGDGNDPDRWSPLPARYIRMKTLPDMGNRIYTQMYVNHNGGRATISNIGEQHNASDHDAVTATVSFRKGD